MTFLELQNEMISVAAARFKEAQRASAKLWINHRYSILWGLRDWTFKKTYVTNFAVTAGNKVATAPSDFAVPHGIWRDDGGELAYESVRDYFTNVAGITSSGTPERYTVVNRQVLLDPIPASSSSAWTLYYEKSPWVGSNPTSGPPLVADADIPSIPLEFHYMLVPGATSVGSVQMNDFTYQFAEQEWQNDLASMEQVYLSDVREDSTQWAAYR